RRAITGQGARSGHPLAVGGDEGQRDERRERPRLARPLVAHLDAAVLREERRVHRVHGYVEECSEETRQGGGDERRARNIGGVAPAGSSGTTSRPPPPSCPESRPRMSAASS